MNGKKGRTLACQMTQQNTAVGIAGPIKNSTQQISRTAGEQTYTKSSCNENSGRTQDTAQLAGWPACVSPLTPNLLVQKAIIRK